MTMGIKPIRTPAQIALAISLVAALYGCEGAGPIVRNEPGTTFGTILVSTPRVSGRERLINDRLEQEQWISERLSKVDDSVLNFDGLVDLRNFSYFGLQLRAQSDPSFQVYKLQQEQAATRLRDSAKTEDEVQAIRLAAVQDIKARLNKKELTHDQAVAELGKWGVTLSPVSVPGAAASAVPPGVPSGALPAAPNGQALLGAASAPALAASAPNGSAANVTSLRGSAIDNFRDLMAVMEEMRSARLSNALDDGHDLDGNTLYRVTFDATVVPEHDTSAWAVIEVEVSAKPSNDGTYRRVLEAMRVAYEQSIKDSIALRLRRTKAALIDECRDLQSEQEKVLCSVRRLPEDVQSELVPALVRIPTDAWGVSRDPGVFLRPFKVPQARGVNPEEVMSDLLFGVEERRFNEHPLACFFDLKRAPIDGGFIPRVDERSALSALDAIAQRIGCTPFSTPDARLASFKGFLESRTRASVYSVTPIETVQRLSEVSAARSVRELLVGLSALTGTGSVSAGLQQLRANEILAQAIRRQPVVVGFGGGPKRSGESVKFGWVLGPQFSTTPDGKSTHFRHSVKQHAVSALVSLPAWLSSADFKVTTYWLPENGLPSGRPPVGPSPHVVRLPARPRASIDALGYGARTVEPDEFQFIEVAEGAKASVLITGRGLWRSTEVYVGAQKARTVTVLPDMLGVRADFDELQAPYGSQLNTSQNSSGMLNLTVFTSEGSKVAGMVRVKWKDPLLSTVAVLPVAPRLVVGKKHHLDFIRPIGGFADFKLLLRSPLDATFNESLPDFTVTRDLKAVDFTPSAAAATKLKTGDRVDLVLALTRSAGGQTEHHVLMRNATLFAAESDSMATVKAKGTPKTLPLEVTVTFNAAQLESFASLGRRRIDVLALGLVGDDVPFLLGRAPCSIEKNACTVRVTASAANLKAFNEAKGAKLIRLELDGRDVPLLKPSEVVLVEK